MEQIGGIRHRPGGHRGGAVIGEHLEQLEVQVEFGGVGGRRDLLDADPVERHLKAHSVLEGHGHLKQRMMRRGAHRVELLDQPLKRNILVAVGVDAF